MPSLYGTLEMVELLLCWLTSLVKSRCRLRAENLFLRHQLIILRRRALRRLRVSNADRLVFGEAHLRRLMTIYARYYIGPQPPLGHPTPSRDDVAMTKAVAAAAEKLGILLHDHLVVGRKGHKSLRALKLI
jgi:DNA repair protein RadC